jgi:hypothetical protein
METQDGFILGVYNYCDRWCERCSLASRCRVYAEELNKSLDMPEEELPSDPPRGASPVVRSLGAVAAAFEASIPDELFVWGAKAGTDEGDADTPRKRPELEPAELGLQERVQALGLRFWKWLAPESRAGEPLVTDAVEVLQHFGIYIGPKVHRALRGRRDGEEDGMPSDAIGSAKAALLALERLGDAWLQLAEHGVISVLEAAPVLTELQAVIAELEGLFPRARDFVRPGFDEPEAVAMLEWRERG